MPAANPKIAVIGAGLTGLLVAHGLQKNGFDVVIYDRDASVDSRSRDWTIVLHWALPVMQSLLPKSLAAKLSHAICNPDLAFDASVETLAVYNGITGDKLFASPMPGSRRISRQRLRQVLVEGLDVKWGKKLEKIEKTETTDADVLRLVFEDGTEDAGYVLAADGASSRVRALVVGDATKAQSTPSGLLFATAIVNYKDEAKVKSVTDLHPVAAIAMGADAVGGCGVLHVNDGKGGPARAVADWTTFVIKIWRGTLPAATSSSDVIRLLKESDSSKSLAAPFSSQIDWIPEDGSSVCYVDEMKYWVAPGPFGTDTTLDHRVTLAGDAAHPMLIYRGQGFQHAITDADNYVKALVSIRAAGWSAEARRATMAAYDAEMVERGGKAVAQSVQEAALSFDVEKVQKMLMARQGHGRSA
ncbi:fad-binding domain containing protein [Ophiostoma piceae UAMH 11346]|uniref:Fad-binding domain containing protein n=1 Tax=Ophiostoma piceae (strain UAMH 11346) TaxID=1262450 RepID=S3C4B0_OPHP1|nr:fad-binding domain containing protein [Ophiostoma piceae UAMH 11346]